MFRFSEWSKHSPSSVLPQSYSQPYSNSQWLALKGMRLVAAAAKKWTHTVTATVYLGEHKLGFWLSKYIRMIPPIWIVGVPIWGVCWPSTLTHYVCLLLHQIPY